MAVYKATYCYPFLGSCDLRVGPGETQWITCKVDSSNKRITGYRIKIYDEDNKVVFPLKRGDGGDVDWNVSPLSELISDGVLLRSNGKLVMEREDGTLIELPSQEYMTNSGENGTYLNVPFFQNANGRILGSANAVYYTIRELVDYLIEPLGESAETVDNSMYWSVGADGKYRYDAGPTGGYFSGELNGDSGISAQATALFVKTDGEEKTVFVAKLLHDDAGWYFKKEKELPDGAVCVVLKGVHHNVAYSVSMANENPISEYFGEQWEDADGNKISFSAGKMYKWEIALYQGDGEESEQKGTDDKKKYSLMDYSGINVDFWYDMMLQRAQILGSTPNRIQIAKEMKDGTYAIPANVDGSYVVLYQTYAQLMSGAKESGFRFLVNSYSSSLGHVYPLESDAANIPVASSDKIKFYKHSNNEEYILDTDIVQAAATGNTQRCGIVNVDGVVGQDGMYVLLMHQTNPAENGVYKMVGDSSSKITCSNGKIYKRDSSADYQNDVDSYYYGWTYTPTSAEAESGVKAETYYTKSRIAAEGDRLYNNFGNQTIYSVKQASIVMWQRAGGYTSWSDFIGKIIYVKNGNKNGRRNFSSTAQIGGTLLDVSSGSNSASDGGTLLYFVEEKPIVLFPQMLSSDYDIKALGAFSADSSPKKEDKVDGVLLAVGDYYINETTGDIFKYSTTGNPGEKVFDHTSIEDGSFVYYYIQQGEKNGLSVCKIGKAGIAEKDSEDLSEAEVLKNTTTRTFVGASTSLAPGMVLMFGDRVVKTAAGDKKKWLRAEKVDSTVWFVEHEELSEPFKSYSDDPSIPYWYELRSFYKKSDENPFYYYEAPYLRMKTGLGDYYVNYSTKDVLTVPVGESPAGSVNYKEFQVVDENKGLSNKTNGEIFDALSYYSGVDESLSSEWSFSIDSLGTETSAPSGEIPLFSISKGTSAISFAKKWLSEAEIKKFVDTVGDTYKMSASQKPKYIGAGVVGLEKLNMPKALRDLSTTIYGTKQNFVPIKTMRYSPNITSGYKAMLTGLYYQGDGGSWESYRWILERVAFKKGFEEAHSKDFEAMMENNDPILYENIDYTMVVQDTGNKYDRNLSASFEGLLGNASLDAIPEEPFGGKKYSNVYLVTLRVLDERGVETSIKRLLKYESPDPASFDYRIGGFSASVDCSNACVSIDVDPRFIKETDEGESYSDDPFYEAVEEFSIFKREYKLMYRRTGITSWDTKAVAGVKWSPVSVGVKISSDKAKVNIRDFNVLSGHSYQYVLFPGNYSDQSVRIPYIYANAGNGKTNGAWNCYIPSKGAAVVPTMQYWSIVGLIPESNESEAPTGVDSYVADPENVWLFKYQMEGGSLSQNLSKSEIGTLGKYAKIGVGRKNYLSGSVSCYLGSEIAPMSDVSYLERMPKAKVTPLSTNEKAFMVGKWREFVRSANPKLLRDTKGQGWIVQIIDGSTTTGESYTNKPDVINFSWRQIGDVETVSIYSRDDALLGDISSHDAKCGGTFGEWVDECPCETTQHDAQGGEQ